MNYVIITSLYPNFAVWVKCKTSSMFIDNKAVLVLLIKL